MEEQPKRTPLRPEANRWAHVNLGLTIGTPLLTAVLLLALVGHSRFPDLRLLRLSSMDVSYLLFALVIIALVAIGFVLAYMRWKLIHPWHYFLLGIGFSVLAGNLLLAVYFLFLSYLL